MDCLCNKVKPLAVLFWALGIVLANTWPLYAGMASLNRRTQSMSLYGHATCTVVEIFFTLNYQRRLVGPPFSLSRFFIYSIYGWNSDEIHILMLIFLSAASVSNSLGWRRMDLQQNTFFLFFI